LDPLLVPQVIDLLGNDDTARAAHEALAKNAAHIAGQLVDRLADTSVSQQVRRRIPRILASAVPRWEGCSGCAVAWSGLFGQLNDERFEIRVRCAKALEKLLERNPQFGPEQTAVFAIVERELNHQGWRAQGVSGGGADEDLFDEVLKERASQSLSHVCTLLSLVLPTQSVRLAFRALQTEDAKLRGVALEYFESVLPRLLSARLAARLEGPPPQRPKERTRDATESLLESQPSIMARLEELGFDGSAQRQVGKTNSQT